MGTQEDFILDLHYANWVWNHIKSSQRVYWPEDERFYYQIEAGIETKKYYRDGTWDRESATDYQEATDIGVPDFIGTPKVEFMKGLVRSVYIAGVSYTTIGSWYTFEITEDEEDDEAMFDPIRLPVTYEMIPEAKKFARDRGGSFIREKGVEFQERYATALSEDEARLAASDLNDVHVKIPARSEQEAKEVIREATAMAERAVREVK